MDNGSTYADLLKQFDPYHVTSTPDNGPETKTNRNIVTTNNNVSNSVLKPLSSLTTPIVRSRPATPLNLTTPIVSSRPSTPVNLTTPIVRSRPATPVLRAEESNNSAVYSTTSQSLYPPVPSTTIDSTGGSEVTFFSFVRNPNKKDSDGTISESSRINARSLAFSDIPLDGDFFLKISVKVPCLPQQPSFEVVESIQATVSDLVCTVLKTLDESYDSGVLSTGACFELHCAKTNECLSGNGKLGEYRVFTDALRFSLEPVRLILTVGKQKKEGQMFEFRQKSELTCQKNLEKALRMLDDQLRLVSSPSRIQEARTPTRLIFQNTAGLFRDVEAALNLQHTPLFRRTISQFEKLASSVLQSQNLFDICRKSAKNVADFVNAYAEAFDVPFQVRMNMPGNASPCTERDSESDTLPRGRFSLSVSSLYRLIFSDEQQVQVPPIFVECSICDLDGNVLSDPNSKSFTFEHKLMCSQPNCLTLISSDDEVPVPLAYLDNLPPSARLMVRLYSVLPIMESQSRQSVTDQRKMLGWANVPLFDKSGCLKSGLRIIPLWPSEMFNQQIEKSLCSCVNTNDSTCLLVLAAFQVDRPLYVQTNFIINPYLGVPSSTVMPPSVEERLYRFLYADLSNLSEDDKSFFWGNRAYLRSEPKALPIILWSAPKNSPHTFNELASFVAEWPLLPGDPLSILRFLLPGLTNPVVTEVLAAVLSRRICSDAVIDMCMPQFVHSLRRHGWKLANALIKRASENHELSVAFYWLLTYEANNCDFVCCRPYYSALSLFLRSRMTGTAFVEEISNQHSAVMQIMTMAEEIWKEKNSPKQTDLQRKLISYIETRQRELPSVFTFPCVGGADTRLAGLEASDCAVFSSRAAPLRLKFRACDDVDASAAPLVCIVKVGDDLRNDMVALQLVRIMDYIWMSCELDLRVITFRVLPTDVSQGIIEYVPDVYQLRVAQQDGLSKDTLVNWFRGADKQLDPTIVDTFTRTCAAWCVASYLIGVGDRHNDNILVHRTTGHLFHIDFGLLFGAAQKIAGFRRDRVPFVFTDSMATLIAGGQEFGQDFAEAGYRQFVDTCCLAFNLVRRRGESMLLSAVKTLRFPPQNVQYIKDCLRLDLSEEAASAAFAQMIDESLKSVAPQFNFFIHSIAQSFVKQPPALPLVSTYSKAGPPFEALAIPADSMVFAEVTDFHKVRYPVKHYVFQISLYVKEVTNLTLTAGGGPLLVYRRFSEINDLRESLVAEFALLTHQLVPFKTRGATENRETAKKRVSEINAFFQTLFGLELEVRRSAAIAKFFKVRPMDLRFPSGFATPASQLQDGSLWMTIKVKRPEAPILEVLVHRGVNFFYDANNVPGRVRVTLLVSLAELSSSKFRTDMAPPGSQALFNKLFVWNLPKVDTWPAELSLVANVKVHPTNPGLTSESTTSAKLVGTVRINLTKMISWATSWPITDSHYYKVVRDDNA